MDNDDLRVQREPDGEHIHGGDLKPAVYMTLTFPLSNCEEANIIAALDEVVREFKDHGMKDEQIADAVAYYAKAVRVSE